MKTWLLLIAIVGGDGKTYTAKRYYDTKEKCEEARNLLLRKVSDAATSCSKDEAKTSDFELHTFEKGSASK